MLLLQAAETTTYLATRIGRALLELTMRADAEVDIDLPLAAIGLDSLVSLELRSWIRQWMGIDLTTLEITKYNNLRPVGCLVKDKLLLREI